MGSSKMAPCKVECHVEILCCSSRLATEEFDDTKGVTRICISKKNRQHNGRPGEIPETLIWHSVRQAEILCLTELKFVWPDNFSAKINTVSKLIE
jgi:hypothetical protein